MASSARIDEIKKKFDENPRRYFAPLANEFRKAGDLEQAILICEEFLPQQAGHMSGHIVYGQALFEAGRLPESRTVFETALGLDPENLIALRHLGDIARAQGEPVEARRWYDRVLEADPRNEEIQGLLASLDANGEGAAASHASAYDLAPIDLDMDDSGFAAPTAPAAMGQPVTPAPHPAPDAPFEALSLEGLAPAPRAPELAPDSGRAEGLEPAEFEVPTTTHARAEGLEPAEFEAPSGLSMRAEGLETTEFHAPRPESTDRSLLDLEGSFSMGDASASVPPSAGVTSLPGVEDTTAGGASAADEPAMPSLDLDDGLAVPAQGDALMGATAPSVADVPLGEAAGAGAENPRLEPPAAMEAIAAMAFDEVPGSEGSHDEPASLPMMELPAAVIAAESALMDAGQSYGELEEPEEPGESRAIAGSPPFVTETMAELYLSQGFHAQALDVYRQLAAASPGDARLRDRVATLERGAYEEDETAAPSGPTVREFLSRLANRRPGEQQSAAAPPSPADFASFEAIPEHPVGDGAVPERASAGAWDALPADDDHAPDDAGADSTPLPFMETSEPLGREPKLDPDSAVPTAPAAVPPVASSTPMPSPSARATTAQGGAGAAAPGTIDALFGTRAASTSEDSAASALAQAFGGSAEAPAITGRPARAASAELSLDSVFRDGPPRPPRVSQSFSFDQFFSESAGDAASGGQSATPDGASAGEPAERSADDVKQFNSWLQGLKPQ